MNIIKNINWKVRIKNPVFWAEIAAAVILPMLVALGMEWAEVTTWQKLWDIIAAAAGNPVTVVAVVVSVWNAITDPTTAGIEDSSLALTYKEPRRDDIGEEAGAV